VQELIAAAGPILPFDETAARRYDSCAPIWSVRAAAWRSPTCASPPSRLCVTARSSQAASATSRGFPDLRVENWLTEDPA
jgi:hypothetical protein